MQIICPISGISLLKSDYLLGEIYADVAPIFRKPRSSLLTDKTVYNFTNAKSEIEKKLWFLAVVNCTDLVSFEVPGQPSLQTCERNFYRAIQLAWWMDYASFSIAKDVSFPRFIIRTYNQNMENVSDWLTAIEVIRDDFISKDENKERQFRLNQKNQDVQKELTNAILKDKHFTPFVVSWLFEQAGIEDHPKAKLFRRVLLTETKMAFSIDLELLQEINDVLSDTFGHSHPMAAPIYGQLHQLKLAKQKGFADWDIVDEEYSTIQDGEVVTGRIPLASAYAKRMIADYGSIEKPEQKDFPSRSAFLVATAKWNLAKDALVKIAAEEEEKKSLSIEDEVKEHFSELDGLSDETAEPKDESENKGDEDEV